jgi:thiamine-phosphate pyrophosphorylase
MLVTDRRTARMPIADAVVAAIRGGADTVQVREPDLGAGALLELVRGLRDAVRAAGGRIVVNDRVDVALASNLDGVHLKSTSLPAGEARRLLGPGRLVGVSTHSAKEVEAAFGAGADYVVFGPVFPTPSKAGILEPCGIERYREVAAAAPGPVLALGGVSRETLAAAGGRVAGIAAIRALLDVEDPEAAARDLRKFLEGPKERS